MSDAAAIAERVRAFVRDVVIPAEPRDEGSEHGPAPELRRECRPQPVPRVCSLRTSAPPSGGSASTCARQAVVFEEAGYSLLGPLALNCSAPDEGNMHLLERGRDRPAEGALPAAAGRRRRALVRSR